MDKSNVKLGIVGFGRMAELVHLAVLKRLEGIEVAGVYDITPQRLKLAAKRGLEPFEDLDDLLSAPIDAVLVATPHQSHYSIAARALEQGKHVLLEKPVSLGYAEAVELRKLAESADRAVTVFHNRRYDSDYKLVNEVIADGLLGPLLFVDRRYHSFGSGASFGVKSFHPGWRNESLYGGGALLDWGIHLIDQLLRLDAGSFQSINATLKSLRWQQGDTEDYVRTFIETDRAVMMSMEINFGSRASGPLWVVGGEKGTLEIFSDKEAVLQVEGSPPETMELKPSLYEGVEAIYTAFVHHVQTGSPLAVTLDEAVETMRVIDAMRQSADQGKEIPYGDFVLSSSS